MAALYQNTIKIEYGAFINQIEIFKNEKEKYNKRIRKETKFKNLLVWFAFENVAYKLYNKYEMEK